MLNEGLYFKYEAQPTGAIEKFRVGEFKFDAGSYVKPRHGVAPEGKMFVLKCTCGSNDWVDSGRTINEYECNGCGEFIIVLGYKGE